MTPLTVTFDTNVLGAVVSPRKARNINRVLACQKIPFLR
jgi:hypothetical protein